MKLSWAAIAFATCLAPALAPPVVSAAHTEPSRRAMIVEPSVELRRDPRPDAAIVWRAHAGDLVENLDEFRYDAQQKPAWQRLVAGPLPFGGAYMVDTVWAPVSAVVAERGWPGTIQSDLSLFEASPGVLGRRIDTRDFLGNSGSAADSMWVSAIYATDAPKQPLTVSARLFRPGQYPDEVLDDAQMTRLYDSLYASPGYRAVAHLAFKKKVETAEIRIYLTRHTIADSPESSGDLTERIRTECVLLADTTLAVNGLGCTLTRFIPRDELWGVGRPGALAGLALVFVAEPRDKDRSLGRLAQRMRIYWPVYQ